MGERIEVHYLRYLSDTMSGEREFQVFYLPLVNAWSYKFDVANSEYVAPSREAAASIVARMRTEMTILEDRGDL